ncbi:hypothetical protein DsansV1_C16g0143061 [Dioscorea sansibarensis]
MKTEFLDHGLVSLSQYFWSLVLLWHASIPSDVYLNYLKYIRRMSLSWDV